MIEDKKLGIIIDYEDFLKVSDEVKQEMLSHQQVEWFISIKEDKYKQLSDAEKAQIEGFRRTEQEPLRTGRPRTREIFELNKYPKIIDIKQIEKTMKEEHKKRSKPFVPSVIGKVCSKKKGGR